MPSLIPLTGQSGMSVLLYLGNYFSLGECEEPITEVWMAAKMRKEDAGAALSYARINYMSNRAAYHSGRCLS